MWNTPCDTKMHPFCLEPLKRLSPLLIRDLDLRNTDLLDDLLGNKVLTDDAVQHIRSFSRNSERNETFLSCLRQCPNEHQPWKHFLQALEKQHRHLWQACRDVMTDPDLKHLLRQLLKRDFCLRCKIERYLDPTEFRLALYQGDVIREKAYENFRLRVASVLEILDGFRDWPETHLNKVKACIVDAMRDRAPKLAQDIANVTDLHTFWACQCQIGKPLHIGNAADRKIIDCCSGSRGMSRAESGPEEKLLLITKEAAELVRLLTFGLWGDFRSYVQLLKRHHGGDNDIMAIAIGHEILSSYCCGNPDEGSRQFGEFKSCVGKAKCENFITLYFGAIEAGIYRATGHVDQADDVVTAALQRGQVFGANKAMAFLYERQGLNRLHKKDARGNIYYPTNEALEASASSMKLAYENYHKTAIKVNDREGSLLYELEFWPLIEFVCIRLGTCITGAFYNPCGVHPKDWNEIEEAVTELRSNFPKLSPRRKAYFYLMYSDYYRRRAERARYVHDVNPVDMYFESLQQAVKAKDTAAKDNLKSAFLDYAQRRIDYMNTLHIWNGSSCNNCRHNALTSTRSIADTRLQLVQKTRLKEILTGSPSVGEYTCIPTQVTPSDCSNNLPSIPTLAPYTGECSDSVLHDDNESFDASQIPTEHPRPPRALRTQDIDPSGSSGSPTLDLWSNEGVPSQDSESDTFEPPPDLKERLDLRMLSSEDNREPCSHDPHVSLPRGLEPGQARRVDGEQVDAGIGPQEAMTPNTASDDTHQDLSDSYNLDAVGNTGVQTLSNPSLPESGEDSEQHPDVQMQGYLVGESL